MTFQGQTATWQKREAAVSGRPAPGPEGPPLNLGPLESPSQWQFPSSGSIQVGPNSIYSPLLDVLESGNHPSHSTDEKHKWCGQNLDSGLVPGLGISLGG